MKEIIFLSILIYPIRVSKFKSFEWSHSLVVVFGWLRTPSIIKYKLIDAKRTRPKRSYFLPNGFSFPPRSSIWRAADLMDVIFDFFFYSTCDRSINSPSSSFIFIFVFITTTFRASWFFIRTTHDLINVIRRVITHRRWNGP